METTGFTEKGEEKKVVIDNTPIELKYSVLEAFALEEGKTYWIECDNSVTCFDRDALAEYLEKEYPNIKFIFAWGMRPVPVKSLEEILKEGDEKIKSLNITLIDENKKFIEYINSKIRYKH